MNDIFGFFTWISTMSRKRREEVSNKRSESVWCSTCMRFADETLPNKESKTIICRGCGMIWEYSVMAERWYAHIHTQNRTEHTGIRRCL